MAVVMHAFQEPGELEQKLHLDLWFGYPADAVPVVEDGPVCRCGASLSVLKPDRSVFAVYHLKRFEAVG